jgi:hypothetical protein
MPRPLAAASTADVRLEPMDRNEGRHPLRIAYRFRA